MKPRLILISNIYPNSQEPTRGVFTKQITDCLKAWYDIKVIAPTVWLPETARKLLKRNPALPECEIIDGIEVYHPQHLVTPKVGRSLYGHFFYQGVYPLMKKLNDEFQPDLFNVHWLYPDGYGVTLAAKRLGVPVVMHALGCDVNDFTQYYWRRKWITQALHDAKMTISVSNGMRDRMVELGVSADKVPVIMNGINHEKFYFRDRDTCRDKLGLPKDRRIILFAGNFQVEKGLGYLVEAYAKLAPSQPDTDLYVIGSGPLEDEIQQQVERLGIRDRVNFVGRVLHESMPDYLGAADFLSLPSLREGCPNTVLETLACGTPVIASRVGAVPEMLYKDHYGLMAEPANAESLYQALKTACEREWPVLNDFEWMSWEENAQQVSKVFEQVMQQTGGNPARAAASAA